MRFETRIPSSIRDALAVQERLVSLMTQLNYSSRDIFAIQLSFEEGITNAILHGNKFDSAKQVTVICDIDGDRIRVSIIDQGDGFEPELVPDPTLDEFIGRPSGRGLLIMRTCLDDCEYSDRGRCLTMERRRNSPRSSERRR